jgi:hypothetical protein
VDSYLEIVHGKSRFKSTDKKIHNASIVARLIRNSFAHDPFGPIWRIDREFRNQIFEIEGLLTLNTEKLSNNPVSRSDYGGPLAIYLFSKYVLDSLSLLNN